MSSSSKSNSRAPGAGAPADPLPTGAQEGAKPTGARPRRARRSGTPGGMLLRDLRERAARAQLWVEAEAGLGTGYLQRVESGKVAQPGRVTVERILDALGARYSERREVLELFGYVVSAVPPSAEELAWAREVSRRELDEVPFPAYVLDCTNRLVARNGLVPRVFGVRPDDPMLAVMAERSMLVPWFEPGSAMGRIIAEPDVLLPALIRALRYEMQRFRRDPWYAAMVAGLIAELPLFRRHWEAVARELPLASAARALVPIRLDVPGAGLLQFRLSSEPFTRDARFRLIFYLPADPATMRQCATWALGRGR